jgi:hypothetical protein
VQSEAVALVLAASCFVSHVRTQSTRANDNVRIIEPSESAKWHRAYEAGELGDDLVEVVIISHVDHANVQDDVQQERRGLLRVGAFSPRNSTNS